MKVKSHLDIDHSDKFLQSIEDIVEKHHPTPSFIETFTIMAHAMEDGHSTDICNEYLVIDIDGDEIEIESIRMDTGGKERDFLWHGPFNQRHDSFIKERVKQLLINYLVEEYAKEEDFD